MALKITSDNELLNTGEKWSLAPTIKQAISGRSLIMDMGIEFNESLTDERIRELYELYQTEWWTEGRELEDIRRMLDQSDEYIALIDTESDTLVGFSRVLTDYVYKALVFDVIVATSHRNRGLGRELMRATVNHPELEAVEHFELYCLSELVPFYEQWSFTDELDDLRLMRRDGC